jgi:hypothetical protein
MRSTLGLAAAVAGLLTYPAAIVAGMLVGEDAATTTVHFMLGSAFVLLAAAMFDFGLNRWVTWLGAAAAGVFGGTFLLQGVADLTQIAFLDWLAFDILGQQLERILPDVVYIWFAALLLTGTTGISRLVGWAIVPLLFGLELAIVVGALIGVTVPFTILTIFLPFIWLLIESVKRPSPAAVGDRRQLDGRAEVATA